MGIMDGALLRGATVKGRSPYCQRCGPSTRREQSSLFIFPPSHRASQVVLVVNNPWANAGDMRDTGFIPGSERFPEGGHGDPFQR